MLEEPPLIVRTHRVGSTDSLWRGAFVLFIIAWISSTVPAESAPAIANRCTVTAQPAAGKVRPATLERLSEVWSWQHTVGAQPLSCRIGVRKTRLEIRRCRTRIGYFSSLKAALRPREAAPAIWSNQNASEADIK